MNSRRFTPEIKQEAVRQIVDRRHSVAEYPDAATLAGHRHDHYLFHTEVARKIIPRDQ